MAREVSGARLLEKKGKKGGKFESMAMRGRDGGGKAIIQCFVSHARKGL